MIFVLLNLLIWIPTELWIGSAVLLLLGETRDACTEIMEKKFPCARVGDNAEPTMISPRTDRFHNFSEAPSFFFPLTKQHHSFGQNTAALHWLPTTVKNKQNLLLYQHGPSFTKIGNIKLWGRIWTRHPPPQSSSLLPFTNQSPHLLCDCEGCGRGTFLPVRFPGRDMIRHERHSRHALHHFHSKNFHRHALGRL